MIASSACMPAGRPTGVPAGPPAPRPLTFGIGVDPARSPAAAAAAIGARVGAPRMIGTYLGWAYGGLDTGWVREARAAGATPMLTWEPWDYRQPDALSPFTPADIADGRHDAYAVGVARQVAAEDGPFLVRFAHEMNGDWYPWGVGSGAVAPADYIGAWRHLVELFRRNGAGRASWVWCPNVERDGDRLVSTHPGAEWVDIVALDGYNGGDAVQWGGWTWPADLFGPSLQRLREVASGRPLMLAEVGCAEEGGDKAEWLRRLFEWLAGEADLAAIVWFEESRHADWRLGSSDPAGRAAAEGLRRFRSVGAEHWLRR